MSKTIKTPDSWNDINISTFQELKNVSEGPNKVFETISILTDEDPAEVKKWDLASYGRISKALEWANKLPDNAAWKREIEIDGVKYGFIPRLSSLNLGNWIDIEFYLTDSIANIHKIMAIFYRPIIIEGITEDYDSESGAKRAELFKEKMNIQDCYGALLFFSTIGSESLKTIQDYFTERIIQMKKNLSLKELLGLKKINV